MQVVTHGQKDITHSFTLPGGVTSRYTPLENVTSSYTMPEDVTITFRISSTFLGWAPNLSAYGFVGPLKFFLGSDLDKRKLTFEAR